MREDYESPIDDPGLQPCGLESRFVEDYLKDLLSEDRRLLAIIPQNLSHAVALAPLNQNQPGVLAIIPGVAIRAVSGWDVCPI